MQLRIAKTFRLDRLHGGQHIVAVDAGLAVPLQHMAQLFRRRQPPGILHMAAVDHVDECADALACLVLQPDRSFHLAVDRGDLLALAQIGDGGCAVLLRDPERDAAAGAAAVEPEHEARLLRRAAMDEGIDAERAVFADQTRRNPFDEFEARAPHQGAVTEHPEVACREFRIVERLRGHRPHRYQNGTTKRSEINAFCCGKGILTFDKIASQRTPHA